MFLSFVKFLVGKDFFITAVSSNAYLAALSDEDKNGMVTFVENFQWCRIFAPLEFFGINLTTPVIFFLWY